MTKEEILAQHSDHRCNICFPFNYEMLYKAMEQYANQRAIEIAGDAWDAGYEHGWGQSEFEGESVTPNKQTFLSNLKKKLAQ